MAFTSTEIIAQTVKWINDVVIGCNFCPFAARAVKQQTIHYQVEDSAATAVCLTAFTTEMARLDADATIETVFLIFPYHFQQFKEYLIFLAQAEAVLQQKGYEGIYQVASFHPLYLFAGTQNSDAANYTNRSMYPMLHLLRESSIDKALEQYARPGDIPVRNIDFARNKGLLYMQLLKDACLKA